MLEGVLDPSKLKHNPDIIKKLFKEVGDTIVANDDCYILFPERYINKKLAELGSVVKVIAIFAIVDKNMNYGIVSAPVFMETLPSNVTNIDVEGVINKVLEFDKGNVIVSNRNLLKVESFMYDLFDEFFLQGKIPWYMTYDMVADIFIEAKKYAGSNIGNDPLAMEIITSIIARDPNNKNVRYREIIKQQNNKVQPAYVGLNNVFYAYDNTLSKIMGGYMQYGVTTSIVEKEKETTKVSWLLRR